MPLRTLLGCLVIGLLCLSGPSAVSQPGKLPSPFATPRLEPVAETRLLMEALGKANYEGLNRLLKDPPASAEAWTFARGQALLLAEMGNLLMIRPPKSRAAQDSWMAKSLELRTAATKLARSAGEKDYLASRANLASLTNTCNRCHEGFRVATRVAPLQEP